MYETTIIADVCLLVVSISILIIQIIREEIKQRNVVYRSINKFHK